MSRAVSRPLVAAVLVLVCAASGCRRQEQRPLPRIAPAEVTRAPRGNRRIERLHPPSTRVGRLFNRQPDGQSALAVAGTGFEKEDVVFWNGKPLATTYGNPTLLSALVPAQLLQKPGEVVVGVRNPADPTSVELQQVFRLLPP